MFIAALFTIVKAWKQSKCLLTDEWIKKMWEVCVSVCVCVWPMRLNSSSIYIYIYIYTQQNTCLVAKLCPTFCNPWTVAHQAPLSMGFPSSRESSQPKDWTCVFCWQADSLPLSHLGSPTMEYYSAMKRNETWVSLEIIILSEIS